MFVAEDDLLGLFPRAVVLLLMGADRRKKSPARVGDGEFTQLMGEARGVSELGIDAPGYFGEYFRGNRTAQRKGTEKLKLGKVENRKTETRITS